MKSVLVKEFISEHLVMEGWYRWLYAGIAVLLIWQLTEFWGKWEYGVNSIFYYIHAPIHEVGHAVAFMLKLGEVPCLLAGSVFQVMTPVAIGGYFTFKHDYRALLLCLGWLGFAIMEMGIYMYDANIGGLTLVAPFVSVPEEAEGDFTQIFRIWGCLEQGCQIGTITVYIGYACVFAALLLILALIGLGFVTPKNSRRFP